MKLKGLLLFALALSVQTGAQEFRWPMAGKTAGDEILSAPQSYIGDEFNYNDLFVGGKHGDVVISPSDGTIYKIGATYQESLQYMIGIYEVNSFDQNLKIALDQKMGDQKFTTGSIHIKLADGRNLFLSGLYGDKQFQTGQKVSAGDTLGFLGYSYRGFKEPSLHISISDSKTIPDDPMTPFGLKTTFKKSEPFVREDPLPAEKVIEDINVFEEAVIDAYPSLDDLIGEQKFRALADSIKRTITKPVSIDYGDYSVIFRKLMNFVHDSHMGRLPDRFDDGKSSSAFVPPVYFSLVGDSVIVTTSSSAYKKYVGKAVTKINGERVENYIKASQNLLNLYDQGVTSTIEEESVFAGKSGHLLNTHATADSTIRVTFDDGTEEVMNYVNSRKLLYNDNLLRLLTWEYLNVPISEGTVWSSKSLNDSTALLSISSFEMNEVQVDSCLAFLRGCQAENLIVDMRNNAGGDIEVLKKLLSAMTDKPMDRQKGGYQMVNKKGGYASFKYSLNYSPDKDIFPNFSEMDGMNGYVLEDSSLVMPDTLGCYRGRVYVLTNGHSYSAATLFPGVLVRNRRGVTVGRETGTGYHYMTATKFADIELPNSRYTFRIPLVKSVFDTTVTERTPEGRGLLPDYPVPISMDEVMMGEDGQTDVMLQYALSLIADGKYLSEADPFAEVDAPQPEHHKPCWIIILAGVCVVACVAVCGLAVRKKNRKR